jgi:hypothetical protein
VAPVDGEFSDPDDWRPPAPPDREQAARVLYEPWKRYAPGADGERLDVTAAGVPVAPGFVTHDSGQREGFTTGARRDTQDGKPRYDLLPVTALRRLAELYSRGAVKYGDRNWEKGMPFRRVYASLLRHVFAFAEGEPTEDHLAAVAFNAFALMHYQEAIQRGELPADLDDMHTGQQGS